MTFGSQVWVASHQPAQRVEVRVRIWPSLVNIGAALFLLTLGWFACYESLTTYGPRSWIMWPAGLIMSALGLVVLVITVSLLVMRKPALVIDAEGFSHALYGAVAWSDVAGLALENRNKRASLTVGLVPGAEIAGGWRWLRAIQRTQALWVQADGMDHTPDQILYAALAARDKVQPPRISHWNYTFSPRLVAALMENDRLCAESEEIARRPNPGPKDFDAALENGEKMTANSQELLEAMKADGAAAQRRVRTLTYAVAVLVLLQVLLLAVRLALHSR